MVSGRSPQSNGRHHLDNLGAISERLIANERVVNSLDEKVTTLQRDTTQQITTLQNSLSQQLRDMSTSFAAARTTNWGTIAAAAGVIIGLGFSVLNPITANIQKASEEIEKLNDKMETKGDYNRSHDELSNWVTSLRDRLRTEEDVIADSRIETARLLGASNERHEEYLRNHAELSGRVNSIDANLIKRPEIESIVAGLSDRIIAGTTGENERINNVIASLNELRHDFGANFTLGDAVKELQGRMNNLSLPPLPPAAH